MGTGSRQDTEAGSVNSVKATRLAAASALGVLLAGVLLAARQQTPPVIIRGRVESVPVPVTVFSKDGGIVTTLDRGDFQIFDDHHLQPITLFEKGRQQVTAVALMDTSESMTLSLDLVRFAAEQFVIRLRPGDKARVGSFDHHTVLSPRFTDNRDDLLRYIRENFRFGNPTTMFDAVGTAMDALAQQGGRRVILLLTDGCDTTSHMSWDALRGRMAAEEIMIYAVQFRLRRAPIARVVATSPCAGERGLPPMTPKDFITGFNDPRFLLTPTQMLDRMTLETGGGRVMLTARNDVNATFTKIAEELHSQYLLAFAPQVLDGREHSIEVRVTDSTMVVRARKRYVAAAGR